MEIRFLEQENRLVIALIGDYNTAAALEVEKKMERVFQRTDCDVLIECSKLNHICSMGLRMLISLYKHLRANDRQGYITNMNDHIKKVLDMAGYLTLYKEV